MFLSYLLVPVDLWVREVAEDNKSAKELIGVLLSYVLYGYNLFLDILTFAAFWQVFYFVVTHIV